MVGIVVGYDVVGLAVDGDIVGILVGVPVGPVVGPGVGSTVESVGVRVGCVVVGDSVSEKCRMCL